MSSNTKRLKIEGYNFDWVCQISPEYCDGSVITYKPQANYKNVKKLRLHKYGSEKYCRYRIPATYQGCGVYIITLNKQPMYVGECLNLSKRHNTGYGQISPRNCYVGGQQTNCRINQLILAEAENGNCLDLWFLPADDYKSIERELRQKQSWGWNRG